VDGRDGQLDGVENTGRARDRLAAAIVRRRQELRLTQAQLAETAGLSLRTVVAVEHADVLLKPKGRLALARALRWPPDRVVEIMRTASETGPDRRGKDARSEVRGLADELVVLAATLAAQDVVSLTKALRERVEWARMRAGAADDRASPRLTRRSADAA
jgi:DNA-binding XRE family transcriptional regulator